MTTTSAPAGSVRDHAPFPAARWFDATDSVAAFERDDIIAFLKAEMTTPLQALQALRATLERGGLSPDLYERMSQHTKTLARRLSLLLEDLVLVTTRGKGRLVLEMQDLSLASQVARAAALFPDLSIEVHGETGVRVRADSLRLQQLLANLIRSAEREGARPIRLLVTCQDDVVMLGLAGAPASDGYELDIIRQLVFAHGGQLGHDRDADALLVTLPRARHPRR
jgi:signal transduction histidine kinase